MLYFAFGKYFKGRHFQVFAFSFIFGHSYLQIRQTFFRQKLKNFPKRKILGVENGEDQNKVNETDFEWKSDD